MIGCEIYELEKKISFWITLLIFFSKFKISFISSYNCHSGLHNNFVFGLAMATLEMLGTVLLGILGLFLVVATCMLAFNLFAYATIVIAKIGLGQTVRSL